MSAVRYLVSSVATSCFLSHAVTATDEPSSRPSYLYRSRLSDPRLRRLSPFGAVEGEKRTEDGLGLSAASLPKIKLSLCLEFVYAVEEVDFEVNFKVDFEVNFKVASRSILRPASRSILRSASRSTTRSTMSSDSRSDSRSTTRPTQSQP